MKAKKLVKEYERQLEKEPDNLVVRLKLAAVLREVGRNAEAVAMYRSVALAYKAQGRLAQAIAVCRSVLEIEPSHREMQELLFQLDALRISREAAGGEGMTGVPAPLPPPPETAPHEKLPPAPPIPRPLTQPPLPGRQAFFKPPTIETIPPRDGMRDPMVTIPGVKRPTAPPPSLSPPPTIPPMAAPPTIPPMTPPPRVAPPLPAALEDDHGEDDDDGLTIPVWSPKLKGRVALPPDPSPPPVPHHEDEVTDRGHEPVADTSLPGDLSRFSRAGRLLDPSPPDPERTVFDPHALERAAASVEPMSADGGMTDPHIDASPTDPGRSPQESSGATPLPRPRPLSESTTFALPPGRRPNAAPMPERTDPHERLDDDDLALASGLDRGFGAAVANLAPDGSTLEPPLGPFHRLPPEALRELHRRIVIRRVSAGTVIVREGDPGQACYVIQSGAVRVLKRDPVNPEAEQIEVARLAAGATFGEFALLANRRRHATVQAIEPTELYEIPRRAVRELAATYPGVGPELERMYRERLVSTLLATAPFFRPLPDPERMKLMSRFDAVKFDSGAQIIREGERAGGLYLVVLGSVEITRRAEVNDRVVLLATLGEGAYFGEMSLLRGTVASATVTAAGPVEVAHLPPRDFYAVVSEFPVLWDELRKEAQRRELMNQNILSGDTHVV